MITKILIFSTFALSLNLIWGYTGLISLGHATYFGVGAYTSTIMIVRLGIGNFWVATLIAVMVAGLLAAIYGIIALRVFGLYFLLVTLALGQLVFCISTVWRSVTGGDNGIIGTPFPDLGIPGFTINSVTYYYLVLFIAIACFFLLHRLVNSPFGYALQGIRDDEKKMRTLATIPGSTSISLILSRGCLQQSPEFCSATFWLWLGLLNSVSRLRRWPC